MVALEQEFVAFGGWRCAREGVGKGEEKEKGKGKGKGLGKGQGRGCASDCWSDRTGLWTRSVVLRWGKGKGNWYSNRQARDMCLSSGWAPAPVT